LNVPKPVTLRNVAVLLTTLTGPLMTKSINGELAGEPNRITPSELAKLKLVRPAVAPWKGVSVPLAASTRPTSGLNAIPVASHVSKPAIVIGPEIEAPNADEDRAKTAISAATLSFTLAPEIPPCKRV